MTIDIRVDMERQVVTMLDPGEDASAAFDELYRLLNLLGEQWNRKQASAER